MKKTIAMISPQTWRLSFILLFSDLLPRFVRPQQYVCFNDSGNYTQNSSYSNNLNILLSSLQSNMSNQGFSSVWVGQNPDQANDVALCRADVQPGECRSCVQNAISMLINICPNQKQAILWREYCMLRYSNESISGVWADEPHHIVYGAQNVMDPIQFYENLRSLSDDLRHEAAFGGSLMKAAAGNRTRRGFATIYMLLQCTPDISEVACSGCLVAATRLYEMPGPASNKLGVRILTPNCNLRYETYQFFNITRIREAQATMTLSPAPSPRQRNHKSSGNRDKNKKARNVTIIVVAIVVSLMIVAAVGIILIKKRIKRKAEEIIELDYEMIIPESLEYDFGKIRAATNNFSTEAKLGQGGFGAVYKGKLQNGQEIAVKRLSRGTSGQGDLEFENEVLLVARLQHRNLVRLLGYALEGSERLLIYEFVENASLDHFIFDPTKRSYMDWDKRYNIIMGIVRGILYIHEDSRLRIIHRDLKPSNILLDGEMIPKIADFGMARLFVPNQREGSTKRIVGTYGYMAPEYAMHGQFSVKSDVFSFGVIILEIICGQKNNCFRNGENIEDMLSFAWRNWRDGTTLNMVDPILRRLSPGSLKDMLKCIHMGLLCVQENIAKRPTMTSVLFMLNSFSTILPAPTEPAFFAYSGISLPQEHNSSEFELGSSSNRRKPVKSTISSRNEASITELYPR